MDPFCLSTVKRTLLMFYYSKQRGLSDENWSLLIEPFKTYKDFHDHIIYLAEHGLLDISSCPISSADDIDYIDTFPEVLEPYLIKIPAKGVDFVRCDGGLSAHLNIAKIQLVNDSVDALSKIIDEQPIATDKKSYLKEKIIKMPIDVVTGVMTKVMIEFISNPVTTIGTLEHLIHHAGS